MTASPISSPFSITGRTVVVIGGGSGIGEAIVGAAAAAGARTICLDKNGDAAVRVAASTGAEAGTLDVRDGAAVTAALDAIAGAHGLDAVIATPGFNVRKPLLQYTDAEAAAVVEVNLTGTFHVLRAAGRVMTAAGRGSIVLYSSIRAVTVEPGQGMYAATKAGIVQLVKTAAAEFGPRGVRVNAIAPGVIETPLTAPIRANTAWHEAYAAKTVLGRWGRPDELAGPALFLVSDAASYVTGTTLFVDGGWTAADGRFTPPGM